MKNQLDKILLLVQDLEPLQPMARARAIQRFVASETGLLAETKHLDVSELILARARAGAILNEAASVNSKLGVSYSEDPEMFRALCLFHAFVELLRRNELLLHDVNFKKGAPIPKACSHHNVVQGRMLCGLSVNRYECIDCGKPLKPLLWKVVSE